MSRRTKYLCLLILANIGCTAVGLWVQYRCTVSSVHRAEEEQAWSELEAHANRWLTRIHGWKSGLPSAGTPDLDGLRSLIDSADPTLSGAILVDRQWRILAPDPSGNPAYALRQSPDGHVQWHPSPTGPPDASRPIRGVLAARDGSHIALACPTAGGQCYVVVHQPLSVIEAKSAALVQSLPSINIMTLVWSCVLMSVAVYLILTRLYDHMAHDRERSAVDVLRQTQNLVRTRDAVIFGLAKLADSRDSDTGDHLERISAYSTTLASALRRHPSFRDDVTPAFIRLIEINSALHDIGKVGVEDAILLKRGPLTENEQTRMQTHATIGGECLREIEQRLGSSNFLQMAREIAFSHHERWDGTGYPNGLAGEAIPLAARIVALADAYDAMSSKRVYKEAFPLERCAAIVCDQAGKHFDPDVVEVWLEIQSKFCQIARQYGAASPEAAKTRRPKQEGVRPVEGEGEGEDGCLAASAASEE